MAITVGEIVAGKVTGITKFGAFIELEGGAVGLVHISEVANAYVKDVNEYLKVGDPVRVKVINQDANGKTGLSIKQAAPPPPVQPKVYANPEPQRGEEGFEDKLARFMKDSNEKLVALKRHQEGKR